MERKVGDCGVKSDVWRAERRVENRVWSWSVQSREGGEFRMESGAQSVESGVESQVGAIKSGAERGKWRAESGV